MKGNDIHYYYTKKSERLRDRIGRKVDFAAWKLGKLEFMIIASERLGITVPAMKKYFLRLTQGLSINPKKSSNSYTFSGYELERLSVVFNILGMDLNEPIVKQIMETFPKFEKFYKIPGKDKEFIGLIQRYDQVTEKQTKEYRKRLLATYAGCSNDEDRRRIVRDLESNLNFIDGEGIFETLLNKE